MSMSEVPEGLAADTDASWPRLRLTGLCATAFCSSAKAARPVFPKWMDR
jgi:hypothetical protein